MPMLRQMAIENETETEFEFEFEIDPEVSGENQDTFQFE